MDQKKIDEMKKQLRDAEDELRIKAAARNLSMNNCRKQEREVARIRGELLEMIMNGAAK